MSARSQTNGLGLLEQKNCAPTLRSTLTDGAHLTHSSHFMYVLCTSNYQQTMLYQLRHALERLLLLIRLIGPRKKASSGCSRPTDGMERDFRPRRKVPPKTFHPVHGLPFLPLFFGTFPSIERKLTGLEADVKQVHDGRDEPEDSILPMLPVVSLRLYANLCQTLFRVLHTNETRAPSIGTSTSIRQPQSTNAFSVMIATVGKKSEREIAIQAHTCSSDYLSAREVA